MVVLNALLVIFGATVDEAHSLKKICLLFGALFHHSVSNKLNLVYTVSIIEARHR